MKILIGRILMINKIRWWLIIRLIGKSPVCMNFKISSPDKEKYKKGIVYGGRNTKGIINRCFISFEDNEYILRPIDYDTGREI